MKEKLRREVPVRTKVDVGYAQDIVFLFSVALVKIIMVWALL